MATFNIPIIDYSKETSSVGIRVNDAEIDASLTAIFNAVAGVSIGNPGQSTLNLSTPKDAGTGEPPADAFAQRELKWLVRAVDQVNQRVTRFEIPCADASLLAGNTDELDLGSPAGVALKSAIDAHGLSRDGNAIVVTGVTLVGRNS
jgi:hypothetical protein